MAYYMAFMILGYLTGSVLSARIFGRLFRHQDIISGTKDGNPGTANAFLEGGFLCGILTLIFDVLKGFLPVFLCVRLEPSQNPQPIEFGLALVLCAPVLGHIFPLFYHFQGGKGIAVTFGCLLGLFPHIYGAEVLAFSFLFLSFIVRVTPHYLRTIAAYLLTMTLLLFAKERLALRIGFLMIGCLVLIRMHLSKEEKEACKVRVLWMH